MMKIGKVWLKMDGKECILNLFGTLFKFNPSDENTFFSIHFSIGNNKGIEVDDLLTYISEREEFDNLWRTRLVHFSKNHIRVFYTKVYISKKLDRLEEILGILKKMDMEYFRVTLNEDNLKYFMAHERANML